MRRQIEHHLFPAMAYNWYPDVAKIVRQECKNFGVPYTSYEQLPAMLLAFVKYMKQVGAA